jgi:predicted Zn finger-like uncharacterized protein
MQSACPQCGQKIAIEDAKVPDRAFSVKCPKCATVVRFPGRVASAPEPAAPAAAPEADPLASLGVQPAPSPSGEIRAEQMAEMKRELHRGAGGLGRALVALADRSAAGTLSSVLLGMGVTVDNTDNPEEGGRLIEQGLYTMVVTARMAAVAGRETLLQRIMRLNPEARRRVVVVMVGEEYRSGDGTQAWSSNADLVLSPRDLASAGPLLASTVAERKRLYQVFLDARDRFEAAAAH